MGVHARFLAHVEPLLLRQRAEERLSLVLPRILTVISTSLSKNLVQCVAEVVRFDKVASRNVAVVCVSNDNMSAACGASCARTVLKHNQNIAVCTS